MPLRFTRVSSAETAKIVYSMSSFRVAPLTRTFGFAPAAGSGIAGNSRGSSPTSRKRDLPAEISIQLLSCCRMRTSPSGISRTIS
jgi:hypothetical protein